MSTKKKIKDTKVFVPEHYLATLEKKGVLELPNLGIGRTYTRAEFNRLLRVGGIDRRVVIDFQFTII